MPTSCPDIDSAARRNNTAILNALALHGIAPAADAAGVDSSLVTKWKDKEIPRFARMLAALGIKCVPSEMRCYRADAIEAIFTLARMQVENADPKSLIWDEPST